MDTNLTARERLVFPLDMRNINEVAAWVEMLHPYVGTFKVGLELFTAWGPEIFRIIRKGDDYETKIFLDLKLHDIPATMVGAVNVALDHGVDYLTVHASAGPKALEACVEAVEKCTYNHKLRLLAVTMLTSLDEEERRLIGFEFPLEYMVSRLTGHAFNAGVTGFVCSPNEVSAVREMVGSAGLLITPGVRPAGAALNDQKRVATPRSAIESGADMLVVGRPIRDASDPVQAAKDILAEIEEATK